MDAITGTGSSEEKKEEKVMRSRKKLHKMTRMTFCSQQGKP